MRVAPHTRLEPGKESEYERVHAVISGEWDIAPRDADVSSWRIRRGDHSGDDHSGDTGPAPAWGPA